MRIPRLFIDLSLVNGSELQLPTEAAHYLANVLRAKPGQKVCLFNDTGIEALGEITQCAKRAVSVRIDEISAVDRESPLRIHLAIGISRGERMDFVLQKSTELGVHSIQPLFCERTEVRLSGERLQKKTEHWRNVLASACEQCGRTRIPLLVEPTSLAEAIAHDASEKRFVLHHRSNQGLREHGSRPASVSLLIGPEGGLSAQEITLAEQAGFAALTLGPRVLRTETAPLAALSVLQYQWGDF